MTPIQILPDAYHEAGVIDLKNNRVLLIILNLVGLALLVGFGGLFLKVLVLLRPDNLPPELFSTSYQNVFDILQWIMGVLILTAGQVLLHESIHGIFFWTFTRSKPRFAVRLTYAYAAAPGWYLPRWPYLVTGLAPLIVLSLFGLAILPIVPANWALPVWYILTINAAGSVGDMLVAGWILFQPANALFQDKGDVVMMYHEKR